jgi:hypothetical protein
MISDFLNVKEKFIIIKFMRNQLKRVGGISFIPVIGLHHHVSVFTVSFVKAGFTA